MPEQICQEAYRHTSLINILAFGFMDKHRSFAVWEKNYSY